MINDTIKSYCRSCYKKTNHNILKEVEESNYEEYRYDVSYQILECLGCDTKSFREVFYDIEAQYPLYDDYWEIPKEISIYPRVIEGHKEIDNLYQLPDIVRITYSEVLVALRHNSKILAGLGLRSVVEAVCNNLDIPGQKLEARINKLTSSGYISKNDAERLHGIRFMGNDAAHDIKEPKKESLSVALQIIEHLIASIYILEKKVTGNIETIISKYELFENLLNKKLINFNKNDEYPIAKYLGKELRRVKESIEILEKELISKIQNNEFKKLKIGKVGKYQNSQKELQHFIVV